MDIKKLLFALPLLMFSYANGFGQKTILQSEYIRKGIMKDSVFYQNQLFTGVAIKKTSNGQIVAEERYENGVAHGIWKEWYVSGKKKFAGTFNHGKNDGEWIQWYEDGSIQRKILFKNGSAVTGDIN